LTFDGVNDYLLTDTNVTITGDQSIETFIKFDYLEGFLQGLISNHDYVNTSNFGINQVRTNKIGISIGYTNGTREYQDKYSTTAVVTGRFYHIVMTFNLSANQCKLYIDGELDSTFNLTKTVKYTSRPMVLGRWDYQYQNYYFDGDIAASKYYSKTLSESEVKQNYLQGPFTVNDLVFSLDASNLISFEPGTTAAFSLTGSLGAAAGDGVLTNGVGFSNSSNGAWDFDGVDDYIAVSNLGLSSHTMEGWINSDDNTQGGPTYATIVSVFGNYDGGASKYTYIGFIPNLTFRIDNGVASHANIVTYANFPDDWFHVALTYDATSGKAIAYLNGEEIGSTTSTTNITFDSVPFNIARSVPGGYFDGSVAQSMVYDRALTTSEIQQNYNANVKKYT